MKGFGLILMFIGFLGFIYGFGFFNVAKETGEIGLKAVANLDLIFTRLNIVIGAIGIMITGAILFANWQPYYDDEGERDDNEENETEEN